MSLGGRAKPVGKADLRRLMQQKKQDALQQRPKKIDSPLAKYPFHFLLLCPVSMTYGHVFMLITMAFDGLSEVLLVLEKQPNFEQGWNLFVCLLVRVLGRVDSEVNLRP